MADYYIIVATNSRGIEVQQLQRIGSISLCILATACRPQQPSQQNERVLLLAF